MNATKGLIEICIWNWLKCNNIEVYSQPQCYFPDTGTCAGNTSKLHGANALTTDNFLTVSQQNRSPCVSSEPSYKHLQSYGRLQSTCWSASDPGPSPHLCLCCHTLLTQSWVVAGRTGAGWGWTFFFSFFSFFFFEVVSSDNKLQTLREE